MTKPKTILALDLGTKCGWAIGDGVKAPEFGTWDCTPKLHRGHRWEKFVTMLLWYCLSDGIESIAYEKVRRHGGTIAAHVYGGFEAHLEAFCFDRSFLLLQLEVAHIKKHATGKGNASKAMMIAAANAKWRIEVGDDNQADALWILDLALTRGV